MTNLTEQFMIHQMTKTNHLLHLIVSVLTGGLWIPFWLIAALNNASKRSGMQNGVFARVLNFIGNGILYSIAVFLLIGALVVVAVLVHQEFM